MSRSYYSEINLHIVWHTKNSRPMLAPNVEAAIHAWLKKRIIETPGVFVPRSVGPRRTFILR